MSGYVKVQIEREREEDRERGKRVVGERERWWRERGWWRERVHGGEKLGYGEGLLSWRGTILRTYSLGATKHLGSRPA